MLNLGDAIYQASLRMVIHNSDHAYSFPFHIAHPFKIDYIAPEGIPDSLGARGITTMQYDFIKLIEQTFRQ